MPEQYDAIAEDYEWLFSDTMLSGEPQYASLQHVLESCERRLKSEALIGELIREAL